MESIRAGKSRLGEGRGLCRGERTGSWCIEFTHLLIASIDMLDGVKRCAVEEWAWEGCVPNCDYGLF